MGAYITQVPGIYSPLMSTGPYAAPIYGNSREYLTHDSYVGPHKICAGCPSRPDPWIYIPMSGFSAWTYPLIPSLLFHVQPLRQIWMDSELFHVQPLRQIWMDSDDEPLKSPAHGFAYPALCLHGKGIASWVDSIEKPTLQVRFDGKQAKRVTKVQGWLSKERYAIDKRESEIPCQRCLAKMTCKAIPFEQEIVDCLICNTNLVIGR